MSHTCPGPECTRAVQDDQLMCRDQVIPADTHPERTPGEVLESGKLIGGQP